MSKLGEFFKACPTPNVPFSDEDSRMTIDLMLNPEFGEPLTFEEFKERLIGPKKMYKSKDEMHQGLWVIWVRSAFLNDHFRMTLGATIFLSLFVTSVGDAVMYFSYVAAKAKERNVRDITLDFITKNVFLFGMFSKEQIAFMWTLQEEDGKNLLDDGAEWNKFLFGDVSAGKVSVRFSDDDQRLMTPEDIMAAGVHEAREIDGRVFFWLGKKYVSTSMEDYSQLELE